MAKTQKESATLVSSAGTGFFYTNRKNKRKSKGEKKLKLKKYDPIVRKHVLFEDKKLSRKKKQAAVPAVKAAEAGGTQAAQDAA